MICQLASGSSGRSNICFSLGLEHFHIHLGDRFHGSFSRVDHKWQHWWYGSAMVSSSLVSSLASNAHRHSLPASPTTRGSGTIPNYDCQLMSNLPQPIVCKVSGCTSKQIEFQKRLLTSSWHPGEQKQKLSLTLHGGNGSMVFNREYQSLCSRFV